MSAQAATSSDGADARLAALDDDGRAIARRAVLRLVNFDDGARASKPQALSALGIGDDSARVAEALHRLTAAGVVVTSGDDAANPQVELAPDALAWPMVQAWIRSHGRAEQLRRQLESDATEWHARADHGASDAGLLDKPQLRELDAWLTGDPWRDLGVTAVAESFVAASRVVARRRWWPGKTTIGSVLAVVLMLMLLATPIILLFVVVLTAWMIHRFQ